MKLNKLISEKTYNKYSDNGSYKEKIKLKQTNFINYTIMLDSSPAFYFHLVES